MGRLPGPSSGRGRQASCHEADHGPFDHGFGMGGQAFVVAVESSPAHQPGQGSSTTQRRGRTSKVRCPRVSARSRARSGSTGRPRQPATQQALCFFGGANAVQFWRSASSEAPTPFSFWGECLMCGQGCRGDHFRMIICTGRREAALRRRRNQGPGQRRLRRIYECRVHGSPQCRWRSGHPFQCGEYVYEHEKVSARAKIAKPCLQNAGTNMQSVIDCCADRLLKEAR